MNSPFDKRTVFDVQTMDIDEKKWVSRLGNNRIRIRFSETMHLDVFTTHRGEIMLQASNPITIKPVVSNSFVVEIEDYP